MGGIETAALTYTHYQVHDTEGSVPCSVMTSRGGMRGGRVALEGGDICIHVADSRCCIAETNTAL